MTQSDAVKVPGGSGARRSFSAQLAIFGTLLVVISVGLCAGLAFYSRKEALKVAAGNELLAIVHSTAAAIDGDIHEQVHRDGHGKIEPWPAFQALHQLLSEVKTRNRLSGHGSPIYTLRKSEDFKKLNELEFVIMSDREPDGEFIVGSRYAAPPHLKRALEGVSTVTGIYRDEEGLWLSAAAPIRAKDGRVVGVLQADRPVNYFHEEAKRSALWILSTAAVSILIAWLLTWGYARSIVRPVTALAAATAQVARGNLQIRVAPGGNDELGDLSRGFNAMTETLCAAQARDLDQRKEMALSKEATEKANRQLEAMNVELERSYDELCRLATEAQSASAAKSEFLSVMSHELRTPLNGVIGLASILEASGLDEESTDSAKTIRKSGEGLLEMIENVLIYTELDRGTLSTGSSVLNLQQLAQETAGRFAEDAIAKQISLRVAFSPSAEGSFQGDAVRIQRVLSCLINNAVKFTPQGEVDVLAEFLLGDNTVDEREPKGQLRVQIRDTGIGISATQASSVFQPFTQADSSMTRQHGGIGIGLALVKKLVESMGGGITFQANAEGPGTTFEVLLPIRKAVGQGEQRAA